MYFIKLHTQPSIEYIYNIITVRYELRLVPDGIACHGNEVYIAVMKLNEKTECMVPGI